MELRRGKEAHVTKERRGRQATNCCFCPQRLPSIHEQTTHWAFISVHYLYYNSGSLKHLFYSKLFVLRTCLSLMMEKIVPSHFVFAHALRPHARTSIAHRGLATGFPLLFSIPHYSSTTTVLTVNQIVRILLFLKHL